MRITIGEVSYEVGVRQARMMEAIAQHSEIECQEHGYVAFHYHARELLFEMRTVRERIQLPSVREQSRVHR